jgi:hypothetical protein
VGAFGAGAKEAGEIAVALDIHVQLSRAQVTAPLRLADDAEQKLDLSFVSEARSLGLGDTGEIPDHGMNGIARPVQEVPIHADHVSSSLTSVTHDAILRRRYSSRGVTAA